MFNDYCFQEGRHNKRPLVLIRVSREHDLVLEMDSVASRRKFLVKLDTFLAQHKKALNLSQVIKQPIRRHLLYQDLLRSTIYNKKSMFINNYFYRVTENKFWLQQKHEKEDNAN